jgi:CheY-like chemotaxis protein
MLGLVVRLSGFWMKPYPDPSLSPLLIVDDSDDDIFLLRHRLREGGVTHPILAFNSPAEALACLRSVRSSAELPSIIFADIRMPAGCGFALIAAIRENAAWDKVRIAVVSTSNEMRDLERALELGANAYLLKFPRAETLADFVAHGPWISHSRTLSPARQAVIA